MTTPETGPGALARALAAAQAEMSDPTRGKTGNVKGRTGYRYAGLDDLLQAVRPVLARHGIAISQALVTVGDRLVLRTQLLHGAESLASDHPLDWRGTPQDHGSELTYARRYSLEALVGVAATDDDDAATATESSAARQPERRDEPPVRSAEPETNRSGRAGPTSAPAEKREHHPSWSAAQAWFCAQLRDIGCTYATLANWCTANGRPRPSEVDSEARGRMLAWAQSNQGREALGLRPIVGGTT